MSPPSWLTDTIARRFVLTEILLVGVTVAMALLLARIGGSWVEEPLERSSVQRDVIVTTRLIEAVPPPLRPSLASAAAMGGSTRAYWFGADSPVVPFLETQGNADEPGAQRIRAALHHQTIVLRVSRSMALPSGFPPNPGGLYGWLLAVRLHDGTWTVFTAPVPLWGAPLGARLLMWTFFLAISISLITAFAARKFARPIEKLAAAVREFGVNPHSSPLEESGPRELRQVVRTFNEMQAQIQKFLAHRTLMLAAISHDLRTPLTRMRLRGELIDDAEQQARHFRDVDDMQAMVDGALAFFRDDAVTESTTHFDLPQMLVTIVNDYADRQIELRYDGPAHAVYKGRPLALKRAVTNLVENALKYATPPSLELLQETKAYVVVVRDRGPGIPEHALENVFLPYYRVEKSRNRNTGGVGLGLTVVQAIVQGHGGEVMLKNLPTGGLEARVLLPVTSERTQERPLVAGL
ncbi:MAG: HAMP domain-containing protein [Sinobacteraceae bacterium]|nr:HAMP domain-containing protein [Nevskiaceae bacterium]